MKREENMKFWRIIVQHPKKISPPPPPNFFFYTNFFLNVGNSMKHLENMKFGKKKNSNFIFFKYLKN